MCNELVTGEGESLLTLSNIGKGIASGTEEEETQNTEEVDEGGQAKSMTVEQRKKLSMNDTDTIEGKHFIMQLLR